jgi:hypothetical protein
VVSLDAVLLVVGALGLLGINVGKKGFGIA